MGNELLLVVDIDQFNFWGSLCTRWHMGGRLL